MKPHRILALHDHPPDDGRVIRVDESPLGIGQVGRVMAPPSDGVVGGGQTATRGVAEHRARFGHRLAALLIGFFARSRRMAVSTMDRRVELALAGGFR